MAFVFDDLFYALAALSAVTGTAAAIESGKAASAGKKAQRAQQEQQNMRYAMERRDIVRKMRMAQASAMQNAENQGVGTSSGAAGGQGSIVSQGNANLSFLDGSKAWSDIAGSFMNKSATHAASSAGWGALSSLAQTGLGFVEVPAWIANFGKTPQQGATIPPPTYGGLAGNFGAAIRKNPWSK